MITCAEGNELITARSLDAVQVISGIIRERREGEREGEVEAGKGRRGLCGTILRKNMDFLIGLDG